MIHDGSLLANLSSFRRGFPPAGPMGMPPMGMYPGPMGIPGPGMGPFMPGLRPGLGGFGGPIGPVSDSAPSSHLHSACTR